LAIAHGSTAFLRRSCQFLVPALTRAQLEDSIRKPIEKVGATIGPELVQRLLNDSSDEMDQLPVLQHCLLRLWRQAGIRGAATTESSSEAAASSAGRRVTVDDYLEVGKLDGALSRHANEILAGLVENEVELVFRALSDVDRERRVIRRSLLFGQLQAETGIEGQELCGLLEPFRADDCSFLTPSTSRQKSLNSNTRIDVGHEALLRRWERVRGATSGPERERGGWWRAEDTDGQTYRNLLFMLETGAQTLPLDIVDKECGVVERAAPDPGLGQALRRPLRGCRAPDRRQREFAPRGKDSARRRSRDRPTE
jgi:hypothetical protein